VRRRLGRVLQKIFLILFARIYILVAFWHHLSRPAVSVWEGEKIHLPQYFLLADNLPSLGVDASGVWDRCPGAECIKHNLEAVCEGLLIVLMLSVSIVS